MRSVSPSGQCVAVAFCPVLLGRDCRFILMLATCMQRVPRSQTRIRVAIPRVNPGSEPVRPPRLAGMWTVADTHTGMAWYGMVWYGLGLKPLPRPRRGHHRAGGAEAGEAEAGAARAGAAAWSSEVSEARAGARAVVVGLGSPGDAGRERGQASRPPVIDSSSEASSDGEAKGHPDHRG